MSGLVLWLVWYGMVPNSGILGRSNVTNFMALLKSEVAVTVGCFQRNAGGNE